MMKRKRTPAPTEVCRPAYIEAETVDNQSGVHIDIDSRKYWTALMVTGTLTVGGFCLSLFYLPSKVDDLAKSIESLEQNQATKTEIRQAIEESKRYTDRRVEQLESQLQLPIERIVSNQEHMKHELQERTASRRDSQKQFDEMRNDVARIKYALELSK